jgi:phosphate-selective porin
MMMIERGLTNDRFGDRGYLGRDIGLAVEGELPSLHVGYAAGVFNGNRARLNRDYNNAKQFAERVTFGPTDWLELGVSGTQRNDSVSGELVHAYGVDFSCPLKRLRFEGEVLAGNAEPGDWMLGAWFAGSYRLGAFEPAIKLERLLLDQTTHEAAETEVTVGCNWYPHRRVELKVNFVADVDAWPGPAVLAQAQMSF